MTDNLPVLIDKLEAAPEGSPELDEAIRQYLGANCLQPEFYAEVTQSLDAAMKLSTRHWREDLSEAIDLLLELQPEGRLTWKRLICCYCAVALRARGEQDGR